MKEKDFTRVVEQPLAAHGDLPRPATGPSAATAPEYVKALTICQPYAEMIVRGEKVIENRTWPTRYRGALLIHAGKSRDWLDEDDDQLYPGMVFGAIVGRCQLVDCRRLEDLPFSLQSCHANGPWCWVLDEIERFETPIPCRGAQGLWEFPR